MTELMHQHDDGLRGADIALAIAKAAYTIAFYGTPANPLNPEFHARRLLVQTLMDVARTAVFQNTLQDFNLGLTGLQAVYGDKFELAVRRPMHIAAGILHEIEAGKENATKGLMPIQREVAEINQRYTGMAFELQFAEFLKSHGLNTSLVGVHHASGDLVTFDELLDLTINTLEEKPQARKPSPQASDVSVQSIPKTPDRTRH